MPCAAALFGTRQQLARTPSEDRHRPVFQADRSPTHMYRTAPLAGLWTHQKGGFFHDGRFATLLDVVNHYDDTQFKLNLSEHEQKGSGRVSQGI